MLGVPVLALATSPVHAAGLLLPIFVVTDMFGLWAYRRDFDRRNLKILIPATTFGVRHRLGNGLHRLRNAW